MVEIYTGNEKDIHKILGQKAVEELYIDSDDVGFISFRCSWFEVDGDLWTAEVIVQCADDKLRQKTYYCQTCIRHGFKVTWANLLKGKY